MSKTEAQTIGEKVLKMVSADDAVVNVGHGRNATTRFANNTIIHNVFTESRGVSITVAFGNKTGSSGTNQLDDESLLSMVRRAEDIARLAPPDPEYLPPLGPQEYLEVKAHYDSTAKLSPEDRANLAMQMIEPSRKESLVASGTVECSERASSLMTSNGLCAYHPRTDVQIGCTITSPNSTGWARDVTVDVSRIKPSELAQSAIQQAKRAANPRTMPPGKYIVVLQPAAGALLASYLLMWANARTTKEGLTYLSDKLGQKLAGDDINIYTDPQDERFPTSPFNGEGLPNKRITWVNKGVFDQLSWDRWTAHKDGVEPVSRSNHAIMIGTDKTTEELISNVERGILVTHFWYVRSVKSDETLVTGMTRDGTFYIEDGKIQYGVKNFRFNESCLGMLQRTIAIGKPGSCVDVELEPSLFPPLVVTDWNFVSTTDF
jgi:predicted Zn-dependent protease